MSGERTRSFGDLSAGAGQVARGLEVLDETEVSVEELAAAVDMSVAEVSAGVDELSQAGLVVTAQPRRYGLADSAGVLLRGNAAGHRSEFQVQDVRRRFGEYLLVGVEAAQRLQGESSSQPTGEFAGSTFPPMRFGDPSEAAAWVADHRASLVAAVRMGAEHGLYELAVRLAASLWEMAPEIADQQWWRDLSLWGEEAAIGWQNPRFLAELLGHSARFFRQAGDMRTAEAQWVRALRVARRLDDRILTTGVLESLSDLYRVWGRAHRRLDAQFKLLSLHQRAGSARHVARALSEIGFTMLAAERADSAVDYLSRADRAFAALGTPPEREHADVLIGLGRAHWQQTSTAAARRCFSRALAILVDRHDPTADMVRSLLRTGSGEPLAAEQDDRSDTGLPVDE